ncbi:hypothetical protein QR66_05215 [Chromobacterium piscinae]|nr:hypothetical protein QR66_05215 [Chromobacterium piscinae]
MAIKKTRFGDMDAEALENFCDTFSIRQLRDAMDELETISQQIIGMRDEFRKLYRMADSLLEKGQYIEAPAAASPCKEGNEIWAIADDLSLFMTDWPEKIEAAQEALDAIAKLAADPDDDDYFGDDD